MVTKEYNIKLKLSSELLDQYCMDSIAYFDIETTGFDKQEDVIILISLGYYTSEDSFYVKQYFAETFIDEEEILKLLVKDLKKFDTWCSYNGKAFDEPFVVYRMNKYNIYFNTPNNHIDLYRIIRPYHKQIGLERCNLKSVEKFLGINRKDQIDGAKSIQIYSEFIKTRNETLKETIMLHNYEDVLNLPRIFEIVKYIDENSLIRDNSITKKQLSFLKYLLRKNNLELKIDLKKISKKAAARIIDSILKGNMDLQELEKMIINSY